MSNLNLTNINNSCYEPTRVNIIFVYQKLHFYNRKSRRIVRYIGMLTIFVLF